MSAFVLNLNANIMGALLPFVTDELELIGGAGSKLLASAGVGSAFGALLVADFGRWFGRRAVLVFGLVLFTVASAAHLSVATYWPLLVCRAVSGFASGLSYAAASAVAADLTPYERRGHAMGRFNAGLFLAIPIGMSLTVLFATYGHWTSIFLLQTLVGVVAVLLSLRCVPQLPPSPTGRRLPLLKNGGVIAILLATMLHVGSFFTVVQLATTWLDAEGLVLKHDQIWVWVGLGALSVVGSAGFGRLSDRVGKRRFVLMTSALLVVCFLALWREPAPLWLAVIACVLAIAAAARTGPLQALISGLVPSEQLGALMGLRGFCMQFGVFLFAMGAAEIVPRVGFTGVLLLATGCQLLSYLAIRFGVTESGRR